MATRARVISPERPVRGLARSVRGHRSGGTSRRVQSRIAPDSPVRQCLATLSCCAMDIDFTEDEIQRYSRHILLQEVGGIGQAKLKAARVLVVGAGGLGSPLMLYLAAAGIGTIGIVDDDVVDLSNLQRQVAHTTDRIGVAKVVSAARAATAINPDLKVELHEARLTAGNALD